jgi:mono/diheme cytochrome c family protein
MMSRTNVVLAVVFVLVMLLAAAARVDYSRPNYEILPDMKYTPAWTAFSLNPNFRNQRTLQAPVAGTIARGQEPLYYEATPTDAIRAGEELRNPYRSVESGSTGAATETAAELVTETPATETAATETPATETLATETAAAETAAAETGAAETAAAETAAAEAGAAEAADVAAAAPATDVAAEAEQDIVAETGAALPVDQARVPREQSIERGGELYRINCVCCHGAAGAGDGPVGLRGFPPATSLLTGKSPQMKDGQLFHILTYGQANMPSFAGQLSPSRRWDVINYVRRLQEKAPAAEPAAPEAPAEPAAPAAPADWPPAADSPPAADTPPPAANAVSQTIIHITAKENGPWPVTAH